MEAERGGVGLMPIRPENKARYPKDWKQIADGIRARAEGQCECQGECGLHPGKRCEELHLQPAKWANGRVVLTVAHLDHTPENCDPSNLKAMCQRCHNRYDRDHRAANVKANKIKDAEAAGQGAML